MAIHLKGVSMKKVTQQKLFRLTWIILAGLVVLSMIAFLLIPLL